MVALTVAEVLPQVVRVCGPNAEAISPPTPLRLLQRPEAVVNIGLETFSQELIDQEVPTVQVDWQPPAGGNERLMSILERMKS